MLRALLFLAFVVGAVTSATAQSSSWLRDTIEHRGWEYVTSIDSVEYQGPNLFVYGDTVIVDYMHRSYVDGSSRQKLVSLDGAATFDHRWLYPPDNRSGIRFSSDPIEILCRSSDRGAYNDSIFITLDLGRTWVLRRFDTTGMGFPRETRTLSAYIDPTENATIYVHLGYTFTFESTDYSSSYLIRSRDTGKTWERVKMPGDGAGLGGTYSMLFDPRQHGLWYWIFEGHYNEFWYNTRDDGAHIEKLDEPFHSDNARIAGLQYPGQLCFPWRPRGYGYSHGYRSSDFTGAKDTIIDWVDSLLPGRPDTASHFGFYTPEVHPRDPDKLLLPVTERWTDSSNVVRNLHYWYYSSDGGTSWRNIWSDTLLVWLTFDKRNPRYVWMTATPGTWGEGRNVSYSVFKKDLLRPDKVESSASEGPLSMPAVIMHDGRVEVSRNTEYSSLTIVDVLGREQLRIPSLTQNAELQSFAISLRPAASQYFAVLRSKIGNTVVVPVQMDR